MTPPRKTLPENITYLWNGILKLMEVEYGGASMLKVSTFLVNIKKEYKKKGEDSFIFTQAEADELIENALYDGIILMKTVEKNGRSIQYLRIPNLDEIKINEDERDYYCYECHIPGKNLQECCKCSRVFHEECYRIDPDISNNARFVVCNKRHVKKPLQFDNKFLNNSNSENNQNNLLKKKTGGRKRKNIKNKNDEEIIENNISNEIGDDEERALIINLNMNVNDEEISDDKSNVKNDCIWVGRVRPPSRRRRSSVKYENNDNNQNEEEKIERKLCSRCRIIRRKFRDPPNMNVNDVNYFLKFVFERIKGWIKLDTFSTLSNVSSNRGLQDKTYFNIYMKLCFKYPKYLFEIVEKIKNTEYTSITEFQCDLMDIEHCIGILYGCKSVEYDAAIHQMKDAVYEVNEIRICQNCYKNSNERILNWFCRPCLTRHELVFAKQGRYSYWPAKVLRLYKNQYDVRFFGSNYSRALIDSSNIKPIDTDLDELNVKYIPSFKKAMDELRVHQELLQLPFEQSQTIEIISNNSESPGKSKNKKQKQQNQSLDAHITSSDDPINLITIEKLSSTTPKESNKRKRRKSGAVTNSCTIDDVFNGGDNNYVTINKKSKVSAVESRNKRKSTIDEALPSSSETMNATAATVSSGAVTGPSSSISMSTLNKAITSTMTEQYKRRASVYHEEQVSSTDDSTNNTSLQNFIKNISKPKKLIKIRNIAIELFKNEQNNSQYKIEQLKEQYENKIHGIKKEPWCYYCGKPAKYYCCWNTNYCSVDCQEKHWKSDHKGKCKRKR